MVNVLLKRQATQLRKQGKSYNQITTEIGVSKSTLSGWLKKYPLDKEQLRSLRDLNELRIERFRQTMLLKREKKLTSYYNEAKVRILPLSKGELFLAGLFLYWGEGGKTERGLISISNTDPSVIKFALYWLYKAFNTPKEKIKILLHLYTDMDIEDSIIFWSKELNIPISQFTKPYIKKSNRAELDEKGFGHGTCQLRVNNTVQKEKILMSIKLMGDYASKYILQI